MFDNNFFFEFLGFPRKREYSRTLPVLSLTANRAAWYDASDLSSFSTTGTLINQWNDKSGNARHLIGTVGTRPSLNASLPAVVLAGGQFMDTNLFTTFAGTLVTAYVVATLNNSAHATARLLNFATSGGSGNAGSTLTQMVMLRADSTHGLEIQRNSTGSFGAFENTTYGTKFIATNLQDNVNSTLYRNDTISNQPLVTGNFGYSMFRLGAWTGAAGAFWNGNIHEILVYEDVAHDATQRATVWAYLAEKWGITL